MNGSDKSAQGRCKSRTEVVWKGTGDPTEGGQGDRAIATHRLYNNQLSNYTYRHKTTQGNDAKEEGRIWPLPNVEAISTGIQNNRATCAYKG